MKTDRDQLNTMTNRELCAYWNILQFRRRSGTVLVDADDVTGRHVQIVHELLNERRIVHEFDALTTTR